MRIASSDSMAFILSSSSWTFAFLSFSAWKAAFCLELAGASQSLLQVCVCVCVCVCARVRECVCVCVCVRARAYLYITPRCSTVRAATSWSPSTQSL